MYLCELQIVCDTLQQPEWWVFTHTARKFFTACNSLIPDLGSDHKGFLKQFGITWCMMKSGPALLYEDEAYLNDMITYLSADPWYRHNTKPVPLALLKYCAWPYLKSWKCCSFSKRFTENITVRAKRACLHAKSSFIPRKPYFQAYMQCMPGWSMCSCESTINRYVQSADTYARIICPTFVVRTRGLSRQSAHHRQLRGKGRAYKVS